MTDGIYLCFDYGEKRIGVAVGQSVTGTATPLLILSAHRGAPDWVKIGELLGQWRPQALVVGHPLMMDGSRQLLTDLAEKFGRGLENRYHLPVFYAEERLTTAETRIRGQKQPADAVAAQIILEAWMAENPAVCPPEKAPASEDAD